MADFNSKPLELGVYLFDAFFSDDNRGSFKKLFEQDAFQKQNLRFECSEIFVTNSNKNVVRGLHFQTFHPQAKLVSVLRGSVWDVVVDLRKGSDTYGKWSRYCLSAENRKVLYIPRGFAHGFLSLQDGSEMFYACEGEYDKPTDTGILFNDGDLRIEWPIQTSAICVGERDKHLMTFREFDENCDFTYMDKTK